MLRKRYGFTIIEVVLVLAIAGLIFLMVFVALPALQRSQRDTQRRNDMSRVASAITQYQTNNGTLPGDLSYYYRCYAGTNTGNAGSIKPNTASTYDSNIACSFIARYLNQADSDTNNFKDPDGTAYGLIINPILTNTSFSPSSFDHNIQIFRRARCNGDTIDGSSKNHTKPNSFAIIYKLEGSGVVCIDNQ